MHAILRLSAILFAAALCFAPPSARAQTFADAQRGEIEGIIKKYLVEHPEIIQEALGELEKRQAAVEAERHRAGVKANAETIFNSPHQVVIGNRKGDVNFVEFFDYNCGYCKRAMKDMLDLMKDDANLRVVLKEFPVLGASSVETATVAIAVRMQDADGKKYLDFHQKMLTGRGEANKARAMAVAKEIGLDMARLEKDLASPEIRATLEETFKLAESMGLNGTPSYVIGQDVVVGAIGIDGLKTKINYARCGKPAC
jgi:protein-disulfide isomerase